ncbi:MAG: hypothetical protein KKB70_02555, partial [Proteobacteria bacterium]|nr:hypothetical protein [Pseudomonadota bacterium]
PCRSASSTRSKGEKSMGLFKRSSMDPQKLFDDFRQMFNIARKAGIEVIFKAEGGGFTAEAKFDGTPEELEDAFDAEVFREYSVQSYAELPKKLGKDFFWLKGFLFELLIDPSEGIYEEPS